MAKQIKQIETLVDDIHALLDGKNPLDHLPKGLATAFSKRMLELVQSRVVKPPKYKPALRMSNIGKPCERQVWLEVNKSELAIPLTPDVRMKFLYGDLTENLLLFLVEASGHRVEGRQSEMEVEGVKGSRDVVIDGMLVDVKSASTYGFKKFKEGKIHEQDDFGYYGQIQTYLEASQNDPLVTIKDRCAFLVMDKTLGHICLDVYPRVDFDVREITRRKKEMINGEMPPRFYEDVPDGKSGNRKLGMQCGYCSMRKACWPELRTFLYAGDAPVYLTKVVRTPDVYELKE